MKCPGGYLDARETVDLLYEVRCDVVHEGQYYEFTLAHGPELPMLTEEGAETLEARITARELRKIVLEGALLGATRILPRDNPSRALVHLP